jgi:hypothetical protein
LVSTKYPEAAEAVTLSGVVAKSVSVSTTSESEAAAAVTLSGVLHHDIVRNRDEDETISGIVFRDVLSKDVERRTIIHMEAILAVTLSPVVVKIIAKGATDYEAIGVARSGVLLKLVVVRIIEDLEAVTEPFNMTVSDSDSGPNAKVNASARAGPQDTKAVAIQSHIVSIDADAAYVISG